MPQFENEYETKPSGARPSPGIIEYQWADMAEGMLRMLGVTMYQHEHDGLADFFGCILRFWPDLGRAWKDKTGT